MMDFISDTSQFNKYRKVVGSLLMEKSFEENPFEQKFKFFLGFEFDFIFNESFFEGLKKFAKKNGNKTIVFYTINPSPEEYFFHHFNKYNVIEIGVTTSELELNDMLMKDPGGSPSDSLCLNSNDICWFSESENWVILCSRDQELAIIGFTKLDVKNEFIASYDSIGQSMFTSLENQVNSLRQLKGFDQNMEDTFSQLIKNYESSYE